MFPSGGQYLFIGKRSLAEEGGGSPETKEKKGVTDAREGKKGCHGPDKRQVRLHVLEGNLLSGGEKGQLEQEGKSSTTKKTGLKQGPAYFF